MKLHWMHHRFACVCCLAIVNVYRHAQQSFAIQNAGYKRKINRVTLISPLTSTKQTVILKTTVYMQQQKIAHFKHTVTNDS